MSRSQRDKGAKAERAFITWLRQAGYPDARRYLAGDGRQPGDVDGLPGVVLEVRSRAECKPGSWMKDAEAQAGAERLPVVIYHPPGVGDPGEWVAMVRVKELLRLLEEDGWPRRSLSVGMREPELTDGQATASNGIG